MKLVHAVFENGVFRPTEPVESPENSLVEFQPRIVTNGAGAPSHDDVYVLLGRRFESGEHDVAQRHKDHQP